MENHLKNAINEKFEKEQKNVQISEEVIDQWISEIERKKLLPYQNPKLEQL